jgi:hypothetical protein
MRRPLFRRIIGRRTVTYDRKGRGRIGGRLSPEAVARAFKAVAKYLKMPPEDVENVSGHSVRVGATQDLLALNVDLASVMRALDNRTHADALWGACNGGAGRDGEGGEGTGEETRMSVLFFSLGTAATRARQVQNDLSTAVAPIGTILLPRP